MTHHVSGLVLRTKVTLSAWDAIRGYLLASGRLAALCGNVYLHIHSESDICRAQQVKGTTTYTAWTPQQRGPQVFPFACPSKCKGALLLTRGALCPAASSHGACFHPHYYARKPEVCGAQAAQAGLAMPSALCCVQASGRPPSKLYSDRLSQPSASHSHALCTTCACAAVVGGQSAREVAYSRHCARRTSLGALLTGSCARCLVSVRQGRRRPPLSKCPCEHAAVV